MGLHNRMIKKFVQVFMALEESKISSQLKEKGTALPEMDPVVESLDKELVRMRPHRVNHLFLIDQVTRQAYNFKHSFNLIWIAK